MNEANFNFITSKRAYGVKYLQFPEVLLYGEKYRSLSDSARLAYMILQNRLNYSLKNNWVDDKNRVYFIFTNQELHDLFGWSSAKVVRIKKELEQKGLLYQVNQGFDPKQKKNLPNRLYLADLEVTAKDVYIKQKIEHNIAQPLEPQDIIKMKRRDENNSKPQALEPQDIIKMKHREEEPQALEPQDIIKMKHNLYNTNTDTNKIHTDTQLDFSTTQYSAQQIDQQNADLVDHVTETMSVKAFPDFISSTSLNLIKLWCNTPAQINRFIRIILNAKNAAQQEAADNGYDDNSYLDLADKNLQLQVTKWIRSYFDRIRTGENDPKKKIKNVESYLYSSMLNNFNNHMHEQLQLSAKNRSNPGI